MFTCVITSPHKTVRYENLTKLTIPALSGAAQILSGHAETFALLKKGKITVEGKDGKKDIEIDKGQCHVIKDEVIVII